MKLKAPSICYEWHPCGDSRLGSNGLLLDDGFTEAGIGETHVNEMRNGALSRPTRMTLDGLARVAGYRRSNEEHYSAHQHRLWVTRRIADALLVWNTGGFGEMGRGEFLVTVIAPAWELDEADALKAAGRR